MSANHSDNCFRLRRGVKEDVFDVAGAVVDDKLGEFYGFEFEGGDEADGFDTRKEGSMAQEREGDWFRGELGER
ncbi:hypothetical protein PanWU01x14_183700 [Parasponia andersonii]|uniref:Uncharacterized protein n=1 Tax=Parasponia andersonii TaxID=3476 RepID=A0A2P5C561_PARAD|nr:hypothetical protein PanWU01x14_183700 [Parasponia andersonii]